MSTRRLWICLTIVAVAVVAMTVASCGGDAATKRPAAAVRHDPRAVLQAYFDALARNDHAAQRALETNFFADARSSPPRVLSFRLLELKPVTASSPTTREFRVALTCVVSTSAGNSTQTFRGSYLLDWSEQQDSWLLSTRNGTVSFD